TSTLAGVPQAGVVIRSGSSNTIGGSAAQSGNLIAHNTGDGIVLLVVTAIPTSNVIENNVVIANSSNGIELQQGNLNLIAGNLIGTTAAGAAGVGNGGAGVLISAGAGNTVGGTTAGARNVISGNTVNGVQITGSGATGNVIEGNYIGTSA